MRRRYDQQGILALQPQAFLDMFVEVEDPANEVRGDCEIVAIRGPLAHHAGWWTDSYDSILERVRVACAGSASTIVLRVDSPGGDFMGMADTARAMRTACKKAGKRLVAYVDGCACSAAYALACAAEKIYTSESAFLGSIGVVETRLDVTKIDAAQGVRVAMVASGARKLDGYAHVELSASELSTIQSRVNSLASLFYELVSSMRGIGVDEIAALDAGIFHGKAAVAARLADRVASFDEVLAALADGGDMAGDNEEQREDEEQSTPSSSQADVDEAREALKRAAADGNEAAQRALDVLAEGDEEEEEGESDTTAAASTPRQAARTPAPAPAASVSANTAAQILAQLQATNARVEKLEAEKEGLERDALINARADLGKPMIELLKSKPLAEVKALIAAMPAPKQKAAGTTTVQHTRGAGQTGGGDGPTAVSSEASALDAAFGLAKPNASAVKRNGATLEFQLPSRGPRTVTSTAASDDAGKAAAK